LAFAASGRPSFGQPAIAAAENEDGCGATAAGLCPAGYRRRIMRTKPAAKIAPIWLK
jgi:hypothetical protein